jgi:hypothetical protein
MLVAMLALIVATAGTSYAAFSLPRNSVGSKQLRNGAVTGAKIKRGAITASKVANHSLTAKQLNLRKLGSIPAALHALRADSATDAAHAVAADNATHAAGADAAATALTAGSAANGARRLEFDGLPVDPAPANQFFSPASHVVLTLDELTVRASCIDAGSGQSRVYVSFTSSTGAFLNFDSITFDNPATTPKVGGFKFTAAQPTFAIDDLTGSGPGSGKQDDGTWIYRNATRAITVTMHVGTEDGLDAPAIQNNCEVEGTAVAAPS